MKRPKATGEPPTAIGEPTAVLVAVSITDTMFEPLIATYALLVFDVDRL